LESGINGCKDRCRAEAAKRGHDKPSRDGAVPFTANQL